jgi:drug/metabolite transporter (DMT)-like permease
MPEPPAISTRPADATPTEVLPSRRLLAIGLMSAALLCFACLDACAKWLTPQIGAVPTIWIRYAGSVLLVFLFVNPWRTPGFHRTASPWLQAARSVLLLGSTALNFLALQYLQLTQTMTIMFVTPLLVALLSVPILGEWIGPRRLAAIGVGFIGILVVTRPGMGAMHPAAFLSLAGACCYALYSILTRILAARDRSETTLFYSGLGGMLLLLPFAPASLVWPQNPDAIWPMLAIGAFGAVGHALLILAHRFAPATVLTPFIYSQLIWMLILGYLVFGDWPDGWTFAGAGIVIGSGLYLLHRERIVAARESATRKAT